MMRVPLTRRSGSERPRFVHVDWRMQGRRFIFRADAPEAVPCRVRLPDAALHEFPQGGQIALETDL